MKYPLALLLASAAAAPAWAQSPAAKPTTPKVVAGTGQLRGQVQDAATKKPVEYATVLLLPAEGTSPIASATADGQGRFELTRLPAGSFRLQFSFVGYAALVQPVTITSAATDLGTLTLAASAKALGEVSVTGQRPLVETRPDRLVYNAEQDATSAGGTATDVLRKTPLLNVDVDGNVQLRGSSNLRILINNKPSAMLAGNLADALKQIPADQIKAIEVITSPSSKYDAEGSAGVINIVLKKNNLQGTNGNIGAGVGNRNQNVNGSFNVRRGKLGVNTRLSSYYNTYPYRSSTNRTDFTSAGTGYFDQQTTSRSEGTGGYGQVELTYDPSPKHSFTLSGNGNLYRSNSPQNFVNEYSGIPALDTLYARDIAQRYVGRNYDFNAGYTRTFGPEQPRREWSVLAQHTRSTNTGSYALEQYHAAAIEAGPLEYRERSSNLSRNLETTLQTDYTHPLKEKNTLEVGAKAILRQVSSDYSLDTLLRARQADFARSPRRSNAFGYQQDVAATYGTLNMAAGKKYNLSLGARLEYTRIEGDFAGAGSSFGNSYFNLLPSLSATRTLKEPGHTLRLNYSRRIQRPNIYYLNPYVNVLTPNSVSYGNPELSPEFANNFELSYSTFSKKSSLNVSTYLRYVGNSIESYSRYNEALARTERTFGNLATNATYGVSFYGSIKPVEAWNISGNATLNYTRLNSAALDRKTQLLTANFGFNSSWKINKQYSLQGFSGFSTGGVGLQSRYSGYSYYSLAIRKVILKEKGDISLNASNFLTPGREFRNSTTTDRFTSESVSYQYQRTFRLSFSYRFGKLTTNNPRRRSVRNDDSKGGGDSQ